MNTIAHALARFFVGFLAALALLSMAYAAYARPDDPVAVGAFGGAYLLMLARLAP